MNPPSAKVEIVYFTGCPNVESARANVQAALAQKGLPPEWREWDQTDPDVPARVMQYGSPTVLVDDQDVSGNEPVGAMACNSSGAPSTDQIIQALG
jgi:hypothetical protein